MAIDDLLDEHEQSERVRSWLRRNGLSIIGGVALAIAAIGGWNWWKEQSTSKAAGAHTAYAAAIENIKAGKLDDAAREVKALEGGQTGVYVELAALQLAKAQSEAGKYDDALATLRGARADSSIKPLIDQRVARLLVQTGKQDEALTLLADAQDNTSIEIRGDALLSQGKREAALEQYQKALKTLDVAAPQRRLLEIKVMDAGGTVADPAESA